MRCNVEIMYVTKKCRKWVLLIQHCNWHEIVLLQLARFASRYQRFCLVHFDFRGKAKGNACLRYYYWLLQTTCCNSTDASYVYAAVQFQLLVLRYPLQRWNDYRLAWNTTEHQGLSVMYLPARKLWIPDILLINKWETRAISRMTAVLTTWYVSL